jgi:DivIVA domain-containing protein
MSVTVDELHNMRFPMARQPNEDGYRASAVDNFLDRVEISYAAVIGENEQLKATVAAGAAEADRGVVAERDALASQIAGLQHDLEQARGDAEQARGQARAAEAAAAAAVATPVPDESLKLANQQLNASNVSLGAEVADLKGQLSKALAEAEMLRNQPPPPPPVDETALNDQLNLAHTEVSRLTSEAQAWQSQVADLTTRLNAALATPAPTAPLVDADGVRHISVTTSAEAAQAAVMLVEQAIKQADALLAEAEVQAQARRDDATVEARQLIETAAAQAEEINAKAATEADQIKHEARTVADRIGSEAAAQASKLDSDVAERRRENLAQLEHDRDVLAERIGQMRDFEAQYRSAMAAHLQRQLDALNDTQFAPSYRPELVDEAIAAASSATPRLDALVQEGQTQQ